MNTIKHLEKKAEDLKKPISEMDQLINATEDSFTELIGFCRGNVGGEYLRKQFILVTELFDELKETTRERRMSNKPYCPKCGDDVKKYNGVCQNCV